MQGPTRRLLVDASGLQLSAVLPRNRVDRRCHGVFVMAHVGLAQLIPCPQDSHSRHDLCASGVSDAEPSSGHQMMTAALAPWYYSAAISPTATISIHSRG